jgi:WD40 repeat protein/class 3 adenylate cyclase
VGGPKECAVLAVLAAYAGDVVSAERLTEALWGDRPPRSAGKLIQNLVLRLRKALGPDLIETRAGGYLLRVVPEAVDATRFERLLAEGREQVSSGEPASAVAAFTSALRLWRGPPLGELADWPAAQAEVTRLEELRRCVEEELADAALALGRHHEWVARLEALVTEEPLRERRWALLMVALYRCGRQADALRAYQRARSALGDLGLEPGPELQATERAVTAHDPSLARPGRGDGDHRHGGDHRALPTGVVTFLLTDVEGSSRLWERAPAAMAQALERHDALIDRAVSAAGGSLLKARGEGDSTFSVFTRSSAAVAAAVATHEALAAEPWPGGVSLDVRIAVHTGEAHERGGDYFGPTVNRAARLRDLGGGGQILLSEAVGTLVRDDLPGGWDLAELGEHTLRGLTRPERVLTLVESGATLGRDATVIARSCPYMGLLPFRTEDGRLFFGRDDVIATMLGRLTADRFLAVVGASGSGKSSLLRAGLVARLQRGEVPSREPWITVVCTPTSRPLAEVAARVAPTCDASAAGLLHDLEADPRALDVALRRALGTQPDGTKLALVVDQLEELFTLCRDEHERRRFLDALVDAASVPDGRTVVVVALRADFFGHGAAHQGLARQLEAHSLLLGSMDEDGLRSAIEGPAGVAGLTLEPGLADVILRDVTGEPGGLPLLSHALVEVWSRRETRTLTIDGYRATGGVTRAIARTADSVFERLDADQQRVARDIFVRLTELGEGTEDTARRATIDELARDDPMEAARTDAVLGTLAAARLVTVSAGTVEVAHEALIREWPRLRGWLDEDRDGLRVMRHLTVAAHEWDQRGRDAGDVYRGPRLAAALEWQAGHGEEANTVEREFLAAGRGLQEEQVREVAARNRRLRGLLAGTGLALVLALLAGTLAVGQRNRASTARDRAEGAADAETVGRLVAQSRVAQDSKLDLALLLALEANRRSDSPETRGALQSALLSNPELLGFLWGSATRYVSVSISSTGLIAAGTGEGTVDLWEDADRRLVDTLSVGSGPVVVAFSPDGSTLAALSDDDHNLRLWDAAARTRIGPPLTTNAAIARAATFAFSADGRLLSAALASGEIVTWDVASGAESGPRIVSDGGDEFRAVAYSPDGRWLAGGVFNGNVALYDARTRQPAQPALEPGPATSANSLAFDRNGARLAAGDSYADVFVWDLTTGRLVPSASAGLDGYGVAFSPRDDTLAAGSTGLDLRDLDIPDDPVASVPTQGGVAVSIAYSPDGTYVAAANTNGSISFVDVAGRRKLGHPLATRFPTAFFSPDGDLLAAPEPDGSVTLLDPDDGHEVRRLSSPGMRPLSALPPGLAFSPDGALLAYGGMSGQVAIFEVATGAVVQTLTPPPAASSRPIFPGAESSVGPLAFSPDGTKLVVAALETGTIFDIRSGRQIGHPAGWGTSATTAFFTPDGALVAVSGFNPRETLTFDADTGDQVGDVIPDAYLAVNGPPGTLVTTNDSGTMRLVDLATREPVGPPIVGLQVPIVTMYVVPGGSTIVAAHGGVEGAELFDVASGQAIGDPFPSQGPFGAAFASPDGKALLTFDGTRMMRWDIDQTTWASTACAAAGRNLTRAEWDHYLPNGGPFRATCPDHPR